MKRFLFDDSATFEKIGFVIATIYVALDPLMIQNTVTPFFSGALGKLQPADAVAPFIVLWLGIWVLFYARQQWERIPNRVLVPACLAILFLFTGLLSGFLGEAKVSFIFHISKYGYLVSIYLFFLVLMQLKQGQEKLIRILLYVIPVYLIVSLGFYVVAFISGEGNQAAYVYDYFPYAGTAVRLIGTWAPTSKLMAFMLFLFSLALIMRRGAIPEKIWWAIFVLVFLCSLLSISRPGIVTVAFLVLYLISRVPSRVAIAAFLLPFIIGSALLLQVVTIGQFDRGEISLDCGAPYTVKPDHPHYGWYGKPEQCDLVVDLNITHSSYFLMKVVGLDAWSDHPILGGGPGYYEQKWIQAASVGDIPSYFTEYVFPLAQSTYITLLAELGLIGLLVWLAFIGLPILSLFYHYRTNGNDLFLLRGWIACLLYILIDLDVQNFRFLYYMIPILVWMGFNPAQQRRSDINS